MKTRTTVILGLIGVAAVLAGTYYWVVAKRPTAGPASTAMTGSSMAMPPATGERKILYYRNPMGLPDQSPVPKKDAMGMSYVPVYADEETGGSSVHVDSAKLQKLGVRTEMAAMRPLTQTLRIVGTLQPDERNQSTISPKFEGWITQLFVSTTGAAVKRGQPLLEVYSPDLVSAQQDYRIAVRALNALSGGDSAARANMEALVQSSLERLHNWDISDSDLAGLRAGESPRRSVVLRAPRNGIVTEKMARIGLRFMPGDALYQITDLSSVWLVGSVFEQDLALVRVGESVTASVVAYPGRKFRGKVSFISPVLQPETRTAQVRVELANADGMLKPAMYGSVELVGGTSAPRLTVPESAVLDTGTRQLVLVERGEGRFEPRVVETGVHADGFIEVLSGLAEHDSVVVNGNFLIDAESTLRAAIGGLGGHAHGAKPAANATEPTMTPSPDAHSEHAEH